MKSNCNKRAVARKTLRYKLRHIDREKVLELILEFFAGIALFGAIFVLPHFLH